MEHATTAREKCPAGYCAIVPLMERASYCAKWHCIGGGGCHSHIVLPWGERAALAGSGTGQGTVMCAQ